MALYLSNLHLVKPAAGAAAIVNTMVNNTPELNSLVTSGDVAAGTPISGADSIRYTFDFVTAGVGTGTSVTLTGAFGSAISVPDGTQVFTDTGIVLTAGDTYGSINFQHPQIANWDSSGSTNAGVAQEEGIVKHVSIRVEVLQGGVTVVSDETLRSVYMQITYDNGTVDTNVAAQEGSVRTPAGDVIAWTNFPDMGGVAETYVYQQNGQLPAGLTTQYADNRLGDSAGYNYGAWAVANTNWTVPRAEFRKNWHGWGGPNNNTIFFDINGVRQTYPNTYLTAGNQADNEWRNFIEWAIETADPTLAPSGANIQNVMPVEISVQNTNHPNYQDRQGNSANEHVALYHHEFGQTGNSNDPTWGGFACSCWIPASNFVNATADALPVTPVLGSMWHQSESGDYIEFVPRRYFR